MNELKGERAARAQCLVLSIRIILYIYSDSNLVCHFFYTSLSVVTALTKTCSSHLCPTFELKEILSL
jgi:hypothetical protein